MSSIRKQVFKGLAWRSSVDISQQILQIAFTAVLARLLTRADFGLVAMALLFTRFIQTMAGVGFGAAIIQSPDVTQAQISAIFFINLAINAFVSLACVLAAPFAAAFFNAPQLISVVRVLGWALFINSLAFPRILSRKNLQFRGFSLLELISMVIGNTIGLVMAWKGFGVWALVFRLLSQRIIIAVAIWPVVGWFPVRPRFAGVGKLFRFGVNMLGSKILYYFSQNMAALITGKFIGVETLGSFNIAYNLAIMPAQKIRSILTVVLTPAFAKIQTNLLEFKKKFSTSLFTLGIFFIPAMLGLAIVSQNFVLVVYGEKWREAGLFLTFLAIIGMLKGIEHLLLAGIISRGMASAILGITAAETAVSLPLFFVGAYFFGAFGLVIAYLMASLFAFTLTQRTTKKSVEDRTFFQQATRRSFISAGIMFIIVFGSTVLMQSENLFTLIGQIVIGLIIYIPIRYILLTDEEHVMIKEWPAPLNRLSRSRI